MNVGFGLGIIDGHIAARKPRSHTIIEAHPDVHAHMQAAGWPSRPGVHVVFSRWQDALSTLGKFDGIFFDTYGENYAELREFFTYLPQLLKPGGIFSYFNGLCADNVRLPTSHPPRS